MNLTPQEEKNRKIGVITSVVLHGVVLLIFIFLVAWRAPDPPLPEYGIELNFGLDNAGTGDVQPETPAVSSENEEDSKPEEAPEEVEEVIEETITEEVVEEIIEEVAEETPVVDNVETVTDHDSPDVVETKPVEKVKEEIPEKPVEKPVEKKVPKVLYPGKSTSDGADGKSGESAAANANQGDNTDAVGDKGNPEGSLDSRALYGNPGGGGGSSLQMSGWTWDSKPNPKENSSESGRIVFEIRIDNRGEILQVKTLEYSVSPTLVQVYKKEVEGLTFSKSSSTAIVASQSVGTITFIIKAK